MVSETHGHGVMRCSSLGCVVVSITSQFLRVHEQLYKRTDGRIGHRMLGVPTLLLRTTGRRSGATRTNGLVYARDAGDYLVVASNGGADRPPAWLHNLRANPDVEVQIGRERRRGTARVIEPSDPDYRRVWQIVNENNRDRYSAYQEQTTRPIPVIAITSNESTTSNGGEKR
jgi:F420H(2)-dependent quinone reductase